MSIPKPITHIEEGMGKRPRTFNPVTAANIWMRQRYFTYYRGGVRIVIAADTPADARSRRDRIIRDFQLKRNR